MFRGFSVTNGKYAIGFQGKGHALLHFREGKDIELQEAWALGRSHEWKT